MTLSHQCLVTLSVIAISFARADTPALFQTIDLDVGETRSIHGVDIELLAVRETKGKVWGQVARAEVDLRINDETATLVSGMYRLPTSIGTIQVDCPITGGLKANSHIDHWALEHDARLRVWPGNSPWIDPKSFLYPVKQAWFANQTSFSNEPVAPRPNGLLYYHAGLDIGGAEGLTEVIAATDARVVAHGFKVHPDYVENTPIKPRYDVIYLRDNRGWYYRYSHLHSFDPGVKLGQRITKGTRLGLVGKEGGSGGWSHLHFEIKNRQPSGKWGTEDGYAFLWQVYLQEYNPAIIAVARPGFVIFAGEQIELNANRSWSRDGHITNHQWLFSGGGSSTQPKVLRRYDQPGTFFETLKVSNAKGETDYDFVRVKVYDPKNPDKPPPRMHLTYHPTTGIKPGDEVSFQGRSFYFTHGEEIWDFGDGSPAVRTKSDGNVNQLAKDGYVTVRHRYNKPGDYLVHVRRIDIDGRPTEDRLHVRVR